MLKRGIGLGLLCIAGHAYSANITVNTVEDVDKADDQCSLREAIIYVNKGMPEAGYNGCGGKDSTAIIELESNKEYKLNSQIQITQSVDIKSVYETTVVEINPVQGKRNATIKMVGKDRIFNIDRGLDTSETAATGMLSVNLTEVTLSGCGQTNCATQGGLIYNKEYLTLNFGQLLNGYATQGGALYNAGAYASNASLSGIVITNSLIQGNKASEGAAIYSEIPAYLVSRSLIRDNEVTSSGGAVFESKDQFTEQALDNMGDAIARGILNSTLFNNKGYVVKVYDGMQVNNVTMLLNSMGLIVNAPFKKGFVANSIIAQNGSQDCTIQAGGEADQISNNLYSVGCQGTNSTSLGNTRLIAGSTTEGACDFSSDGILCPFAESKTVALGYFLPRILPNYTKLSDSPIVNRGPLTAVRCSTEDQRGKSRPSTNSELCDRGSIELVLDTTTTTSVGSDITYGQTASFSISDQLQDGELVSAEECKAIFKKDTDDNGNPWKTGCLKIVQTNTVSKGTMTINQAGDLVYTPNGNWHGSDEFKINVVTSTTRFNESGNPYISITGRVVQSPPNDFKSDKVKVSGGSLGVVSLFGLLGLVAYRRKKYN